MKKIHFCIIAVILFIAFSTHAQEFTNDYSPIRSSGKLPDDFIINASSKAEKDIEKLKKAGGTKSKEKIKFIVSNTFFIDNVLKSGKVLYGDPISSYIKKVASEVLKNDVATNSKLRFYVIKSPIVNAYAFDNGVILFTTGLISQLENEAQLAFVISHEVIHFKKKHSMTAHIEFIGAEKKKRTYNRNGTNLLLEKSKFSKKQESQADEEGFKIFSNTSYSYASIDGLFDVLQYSYLPFEDIEFDKHYFNDKNYIIPNNYYLSGVNDINSNDNYSDSLSTHPNIKKRRESIKNDISGKSNTDRKEFIVSQSEFERVREICRFETCRMYVQELDYPNAIYSAYALLKKYPNNLYLKKIIAHSLYEVAAYKNLYENYLYYSKIEKNRIVWYKKRIKSFVERNINLEDSIQGSSQQVYHLLNKMNPYEASILALRENWKLYQQEDYKDSYAGDICDSLMVILSSKYKTKIDDFSKTPNLTSADTIKEAPDKALTKYDKIRKNSKHKISDNSFCKYAFVDILNDKKFVSRYADIAKKSKKSESANAKTKSGSKQTAKSKSRSKKDDNDDEKDAASSTQPDSVKIEYQEVLNASTVPKPFKNLGIDKIVIVEPTFIQLDDRKKDKIVYFAGEKRLKGFTNALEASAKRINLDYTLISTNSFSANDVENYNTFSDINDWVSERVFHNNFDKAIVLNNDFKTKLINKFGTKYFLWTGTASIQDRKQMGLYAVLTVLYPVILPYTIIHAISPSWSFYYYAILFNVETGKVELYQEHEMEKMKENDPLLKTIAYDTFFQIKKGNKK